MDLRQLRANTSRRQTKRLRLIILYTTIFIFLTSLVSIYFIWFQRSSNPKHDFVFNQQERDLIVKLAKQSLLETKPLPEQRREAQALFADERWIKFQGLLAKNSDDGRQILLLYGFHPQDIDVLLAAFRQKVAKDYHISAGNLPGPQGTVDDLP